MQLPYNELDNAPNTHLMAPTKNPSGRIFFLLPTELLAERDPHIMQTSQIIANTWLFFTV